MMFLWSALLLFASSPVPSVDVHADKDVPVWVTEQWHSDSKRLMAAYDELLAVKPAEDHITLHGSHPSAEPQRRDIRAYAELDAVFIALEGEGWEAPTTRARRVLQQNLAHEIAHVWHRAAYDGDEPKWLHEGFAEALALNALERSDLWTSKEINAYRTELDAQCAEVLAEGVLMDAMNKGDLRANYACGFIIVDATSRVMGLPAMKTFEIYIEGRLADKELERIVAERTSLLHTRRVRRFLFNDYTHLPPERVIALLRSGRL